MTWKLRRNRTKPGAPFGKGSPCDWCKCDTCAGKEKVSYADLYSVLLADGTRMCDTCWNYPPCGGADDCDTFRRTDECHHRPKKSNNAKWQKYSDVIKVLKLANNLS